MIKIPQDGKFSQPNNSDLFGNIWYTKNMNFDEEGYAKLSSRTVSFKSEQDDANFNLPLSFGRAGTEFHIVTADQPFDLQLLETDFSIAEDTESNNPSCAYVSWGEWFNNKWHASTNTKIWTTTGGAWTDSGASLTTGKVHALETFVNKNSLAVTNANTVLLLDTSYSTTVTLTIPAEFETVGLAYSNGRMGVVTMMASSVAGQNKEAYFFVWDGSSTEAGQGLPVGSDTVVGIAAYGSSWVLLTRTGELKYFNGGGFETLATLPIYYLQATWGDSQNREVNGDALLVEGDVIYINVGNDLSIFGKKGETYLQNYPSGVLCYDPHIGLYHRYSPSLSPAYQIVVASANVNTTTDIITITSGTIPATGNPIKQFYNTESPIGGVTIGQTYFVIRHSASTFSLAETKADAENGVKVDLTSGQDARFIALNVLDYGASRFERSGGIGVVEQQRVMADHIIFGSEVIDFNSSTAYDTLNLTVAGFENRGYFVTAKINSNNITDTTQKVFVKYRPLKTDDQIIVKVKDADVLGIPTSTPQFNTGTMCSWTAANVFTTTADLSDIKDYLDADSERECEVEIISGAGAGQMSQISTITESNGTYTVTLSDDIDGATSGYTCDVSIDNWKKLGEITSTDTEGWKEFPVASASKWFKFKVELRGSETTIEELQFVNTPHITTQ